MAKKMAANAGKKKTPFFKKWWVWLIIVLAFIGALMPKDADEADTDDTSSLDSAIVSENKTDDEPEAEQIIEPTPDPAPAATPEPTPEAVVTPTPETTPEPDATPEPTPDSTPTIIPPEDSTFSVKFIDVGQADAALVECDGHYMLIDGGNKEDSNLIYSVLKKDGISHLDIVVGTHAHEDHIGGIPGAFNYATADLTLCPVTFYDSEAFSDFSKYADKNGNGIVIPNVGDQFSLGSASVTILGVNSDSDTNNTSIVLSVQYGSTSFLFTGDAEREAEQVILDSGYSLSATVLKVGHHGSDTSTTYPFLREIMPEYAVISVGKGNSYEHPTDNTLSRLRDADVTIFRTDLNGDIVFTSDGQKVSVSVAKQASNEDIMTPGGTVINTPPTSTTTDDVDSDTPATGVDYIVNTNTKKFHYPSCSSVKKMKESNKWFYTGTRDDLISQGYSPCGNCHP